VVALNFPGLAVEIAFVADPYSTSLVWTDVTQYVDSIDTGRGRNYELSKTEAGTATVVLRNFDGRFDPGNTGSPYAPYILPYRPIRIRATWLTITYNVWSGYVERWPQTWTMNGIYGVVTITAVDGFKAVLARTLGPRYVDRVVADAPTYFFVISATSTGAAPDISGSTIVSHTASTSLLYTYPGQLRTSNPMILGSPLAVVEVTSTGTNYEISGDVYAPFGAGVTAQDTSGYLSFNPNGTTDFAIEILYQPLSIPTDGSHADVFLQYLQVPGSPPGTVTYGSRLRCNFLVGGATYTLALDTAPTVITITAAAPIAGRTDHWVVTRISGVVYVYQNGALVGQQTYGGIAFGGNGSSSRLIYAASMTSPTSFKADVASVALTYGAGLTAAQVADHYSAATRYREFATETSGNRVTHVLDSVSWPAAQRSVPATGSSLQPTGSTTGTTCLAIMQAAAEAELGNVFIDGAGRFVFQPRALRSSATVAATFGEGSGETPYDGNIAIEFDDQLIYNDVQVTQSGTSPAFVSATSNLSAQTSYGLRTLARTAALTNASDVISQAATLLAWYKDPRTRIPNVSMNGVSNPDSFIQTLGREIGDLVTIKRRPPGAPMITTGVFIDGVKHSITPTSWVTTFMLTPQLPAATY
jgi:hypothetical protein